SELDRVSHHMSRQFVILEHDHPFLHWDLLIEESPGAAQLLSWRLLEPVSMGKWLPAEPLPLHRSAYLTYEGAVSGGRGFVTRLFSGLLIEESAEPPLLTKDISMPDVTFTRQQYRIIDCQDFVKAEYRCHSGVAWQWCFE
ncbi:MAG: hypothetical protein KDA81_18765, partial [Planctomycetaceae bacterium]|nr:hypothetical protein [Planctomycetaceae bacterium]